MSITDLSSSADSPSGRESTAGADAVTMAGVSKMISLKSTASWGTANLAKVCALTRCLVFLDIDLEAEPLEDLALTDSTSRTITTSSGNIATEALMGHRLSLDLWTALCSLTGLACWWAGEMYPTKAMMGPLFVDFGPQSLAGTLLPNTLDPHIFHIYMEYWLQGTIQHAFHRAVSRDSCL